MFIVTPARLLPSPLDKQANPHAVDCKANHAYPRTTMKKNNRSNQFYRQTLPLFAFAVLAGCAGFSLNSSTAAGGPSGNSGSGSTHETRSSSETSAPSAALFDEVSEEDNKQLAREFKVILRTGKIAKLYADGELFTRVEAICGKKVWDQCQMLYSSERNALGWPRWSFKRRGQSKVYQYPEMFYEETESQWSEQALHTLSTKGEDADLFIKMVSDKCGEPFDSDCEVRAIGESHGTYRLTVRDSGEVIKLMSTLHEWKEDM